MLMTKNKRSEICAEVYQVNSFVFETIIGAIDVKRL